MLKCIKNQKGVTLVELIVAMIVMSIIMMAVTAVFAPIYQTYIEANELAEVNSLLDTISAVIMDDLADATVPAPAPITATLSDTSGVILGISSQPVANYRVNNGLLERNTKDFTNEGDWFPIYAQGFSRNKNVEVVFSEAGGVCTVTIILTDNRPAKLGREVARRSYVARPVGLQPPPPEPTS